MPKRTRKTKSSTSKSTLFAWPKVLVLLIPLFVGVFLIVNGAQQSGVLGVSDLNQSKLNKEHNPSISPRPTGTTCKPIKVTSISLSNPCAGDKIGFQTVTYTCADQTSGSLSITKCGNPEDVFQRVRQMCNKNSTCKRPEPSRPARPSLSPKPTVTPAPTQ